MDQLPADVVEQYQLEDKVTSDGYVYIEVRKGMYGLLQAGLLAQQLLEKRLEKVWVHTKQTNTRFVEACVEANLLFTSGRRLWR